MLADNVKESSISVPAGSLESFKACASRGLCCFGLFVSLSKCGFAFRVYLVLFGLTCLYKFSDFIGT